MKLAAAGAIGNKPVMLVPTELDFEMARLLLPMSMLLPLLLVDLPLLEEPEESSRTSSIESMASEATSLLLPLLLDGRSSKSMLPVVSTNMLGWRGCGAAMLLLDGMLLLGV